MKYELIGIKNQTKPHKILNQKKKKTCESNSNCGSLVNQSYKTFFDLQRNRTIVDITTHKSIKQMKMSCFVWCGIIFPDYFDSQSNFTWRQTSINRERFIGSTVFSSSRIFFFFHEFWLCLSLCFEQGLLLCIFAQWYFEICMTLNVVYLNFIILMMFLLLSSHQNLLCVSSVDTKESKIIMNVYLTTWGWNMIWKICFRCILLLFAICLIDISTVIVLIWTFSPQQNLIADCMLHNK